MNQPTKTDSNDTDRQPKAIGVYPGGAIMYDDDDDFDRLIASEKSMKFLAKMAEEAIEDYKAGRTLPIESLWDDEA